MNNFDLSTKKLIDRHGHLVTYIQVIEGEYNVETGSNTNSEVSVQIDAYPKIVKATQFNYPNLVGKEVIEFLMSATLLNLIPQSSDKVIYSGNTYSVVSHIQHSALGQVLLYRILTTKL